MAKGDGELMLRSTGRKPIAVVVCPGVLPLELIGAVSGVGRRWLARVRRENRAKLEVRTDYRDQRRNR